MLSVACAQLYMHIMHSHCIEFILIHGSLRKFSTQSLEHQHKKDLKLFRTSTNNKPQTHNRLFRRNWRKQAMAHILPSRRHLRCPKCPKRYKYRKSFDDHLKLHR